jgi:SAM-dependent methyltransferase
MKTALQQQPWFASWFDSRYYHQLYRHRDKKEAERFIDVLLNELQPANDSVMLDLGCGTGRHSIYLAAKGYTVFGLDIATASISQARRFENKSLYFLNRDMRKPFGNNNFDFIFSFFTSFGYFESPEENGKVIGNMVTALKKDGTIVIDYLNVAYAEKHLVAVEEREIDGVWYHINRWADERFIYKRIAIRDRQQFSTIAYREQVAKFGLKDFEQFFEQSGLEITSVYGDYELNDYDTPSSKRMIMTARKKNYNDIK